MVTVRFYEEVPGRDKSKGPGGSITYMPFIGKPPRPSYICPTACSINVPPGTSILIKAVPMTGLQFRGWREGCAGQPDTCQVTVNSDTSIGATFF